MVGVRLTVAERQVVDGVDLHIVLHVVAGQATVEMPIVGIIKCGTTEPEPAPLSSKSMALENV